MDEREGMALSGSAPYYLGGAYNSPPGFRNLPNPNNVHHQVQPNFRGSNSAGSSAFNVNVGSSAFNVESSPSNFPPHGFTMTVASPSPAPAPPVAGGEGSLSGSGPVKKKRGRPRKYGPDGSGVGSGNAVSLGLSPLSSPNSNTPAEKRKRGRPPGSGRKQRLASVGEWMSNSAGIAFTPHVIYVAPGEDIASKILSFAQQRPRALCIMSASGGVSAVTLRQPASSVGNVTYEVEGGFEILCLSGSYLVAETGGPRNRTGGVNVSLSSHDGQVIGGSVAGRLIASRPVQVVVCSFVYGSQKPDTPKMKAESDSKGEKSSSEQQTGGSTTTAPPNASSSEQMNPAIMGWPSSKAMRGNTTTGPVNASPSQQMNPANMGWPSPTAMGGNTMTGQVNASPGQQMNPGNVGWPSSKAMDGRNPNTDIDLMRG